MRHSNFLAVAVATLLVAIFLINGCAPAVSSPATESLVHTPTNASDGVPASETPVTETPTSRATATATRTSYPDLTILYYHVRYEGCPWGGSGTITVRIKNAGSAAAEPFTVEINGLMARVNGLASDAEVDATVEFVEGPVSGVDAIVDPDNKVPEIGENNEYKVHFTPPPPCVTPGP